jgi:hypothetical protein
VKSHQSWNIDWAPDYSDSHQLIRPDRIGALLTLAWAGNDLREQNVRLSDCRPISNVYSLSINT